ncbi:ABC transporter substrate-binding protein [Salibaculum sp.]|uniref:ABC transporter substrate-binding protein n=1 Tax=Salibaculum sp. TaxID=2855480 RepID=UPI002B498C3F|nr:ABC transporter substrate-binding protein [Salibaculum sp.]HKL70866.1 ABC transporter substrate-binding protein [Salibaculum sp.]
MKTFRYMLLAAAVMAPVAGTVHAQAEVKVTMPWVFQGPDSFMLVAADKGYYEEEGLSVTIDAGRGSVDAIGKVASGAYEFGFADLSNLIQFAAENGESAPVSIMMVYDEGPFSIFTMGDSGIESPADMEGHSLGSPAFDASFKLFPAFASQTGIDESKVERVNMDGKLRETMLLRGDVDMISGHYYSSYIDLLKRGAKPEDLRSFLFSDFGMDFYGNAVIVSRSLAEENPDLVKGFLRATARGIQDVMADPQVGVAAAKARDGLLDEEAELARLELALETLIVTDYTRSAGFGDVDIEKLSNSIKQLSGVFNFEADPEPTLIFDSSFLPDAELRQIPN